MAARPELLRLDEVLVRRGHAPTRQQAKALVLAGRVKLPGSIHPKPGLRVREDVPLSVQAPARYVSRGGFKLAHALDRFGVDPGGQVCADMGASTGGFTDCLLQRGAQRVYAIDVGYGQLDFRLRKDPRVVVMERTNARYLEGMPDPIDLVAIDASFISLRLLLPAVRRIATTRAVILPLIKPQFEAGRQRVGPGGVVRDPAVHREVLVSLADWLAREGFPLVDLTVSPLVGPAGNVEFFACIRLDSSGVREVDAVVERTLEEAGRG